MPLCGSSNEGPSCGGAEACQRNSSTISTHAGPVDQRRQARATVKVSYAGTPSRGPGRPVEAGQGHRGGALTGAVSSAGTAVRQGTCRGRPLRPLRPERAVEATYNRAVEVSSNWAVSSAGTPARQGTYSGSPGLPLWSRPCSAVGHHLEEGAMSQLAYGVMYGQGTYKGRPPPVPHAWCPVSEQEQTGSVCWSTWGQGASQHAYGALFGPPEPSPLSATVMARSSSRSMR